MSDLLGCPIRHRPWVPAVAWLTVAVCLVVVLSVRDWWALWLFVTVLYLALTHPLCRLVHRLRHPDGAADSRR